MKLIVFVVILLLGSFLILEKNPPKSINIKYAYAGSNTDLVKQGINYWKSVKNAKFTQTDEQNFSTLKIIEVSSKEMKISQAYGEYDIFCNVVRLNADKQLTKKQWAAVISHEIGHYFLLQHAEDKSSVMNTNLVPNQKDILQASENIKTLAFLNKARRWLDPLYPLIVKMR